MLAAWTIDFETLPIGQRPDTAPPKPVGLAYRAPDGSSNYVTNWEAMKQLLGQVRGSGLPAIAHNAKFDFGVAKRWFGIDFTQTPELFEDTMLMAFLMDPYAPAGLKPSAAKWLGWEASERDVCAEWVMAHKDQMPTFPWLNGGKGPSKKSAGAWLAYVPEDIVAPYAIGDVERTYALARLWLPMIDNLGMRDAYTVEKGVLRIFLESEERGMRVDQESLASDAQDYQVHFERAEDWLRKRLDAPGLNLDADNDVADILQSRSIVTEFAKTRTGARSVSKKTMWLEHFSDPQVFHVLGYRNRLKTCLKMFLEPWVAQSSSTGRIYPDWNQVQGEYGGTKTGRPSTRNPNLLNVSKSFEGGQDGYAHPEGLGLRPLPLVRRYILPEEGCVILKRDFSGQELRIFGHFENGDLQAQYLADPELDVHNYVGGKAKTLMGREIKRGHVKILNFQALYGGGVPAAQNAMRVSYGEAKAFKDFHDRALPGRKILSTVLANIVRGGRTIRTYGGRLYPRPPSFKRDDGSISDADYRLLNYLIQGSAADVTKRAMINLHAHPDYRSTFMLQVYDEMNISAPVDDAQTQMRALKESMESIPLRTGLPTDGSIGETWGDMKDYEE